VRAERPDIAETNRRDLGTDAGYDSVVAPGRAGGGDAAMSDEVERAFAPVRACLLCGAQAKASRILAEAREQADSILRQARRGAAEVVDRAQTRGKADAAAGGDRRAHPGP
jgi:cell division septum initiation protein DivIVA